MTDKVIIITGPTASGKSDIAINLARSIGGEIISADSQQIYKDMDIGTNKTTDFMEVPHHLMDIISPDMNYSVEEFKTSARTLIKEINDRGHIPIIAGGTGFYIDSILYDMNYGQSPKDDKIREKLTSDLKDYGSEYLYSKLAEIDQETANKYHPNESNRIIRALEIYYTSGEKPSDIRTGGKDLNSEIEPLLFFLNYKERSEIYQKINNRVIKMIGEGLIEEFAQVVKKYNLNEDSQSMAAIGYKEIFPFVKGEIYIDTLIDNIQKNTRHYAKRQVTWMKRYLNHGFTHEIMMDNLSKIDAYDIILSIVKEIYEL